MAHVTSPASWTPPEGKTTPRLTCWTWSQEGLAACTRTGWPSAANTSAPASRSQHETPSRDSKNAIAWPAPRCHQRAGCLSHRHTRRRCPRLGTPPEPARHDRTPRAHRRSPLPNPASPARLTHASSPHAKQERLRAAFTADEAHISVEVAYHCAQQVREVFHQATPAQGRYLAARLVESLPTCPIPDIACLGRALRKWKDALDAYFDTGGASNAPRRSHQRNHRTRQTHRQRPPKPHQLPTPNAPHRRPKRLPPHPTLKSQKSYIEPEFALLPPNIKLKIEYLYQPQHVRGVRMPSLRDRTIPNVLTKLSRVPGAGMMYILPGHAQGNPHQMSPHHALTPSLSQLNRVRR